MSEDMKLRINSSPQIHSPASTAKIMWIVVISLIPAGVWGVYAFGPRAILVLAASILAAVAAEFLMGLIFKKNTLSDGSAVLTGLLIGYNMPAEVPVYIAVIASIFAIVIVEMDLRRTRNQLDEPGPCRTCICVLFMDRRNEQMVHAAYGCGYRFRRKSPGLPENKYDEFQRQRVRTHGFPCGKELSGRQLYGSFYRKNSRLYRRSLSTASSDRRNFPCGREDCQLGDSRVLSWFIRASYMDIRRTRLRERIFHRRCSFSPVDRRNNTRSILYGNRYGYFAYNQEGDDYLCPGMRFSYISYPVLRLIPRRCITGDNSHEYLRSPD